MPSKTGTLITKRRRRYFPIISASSRERARSPSTAYRPFIGVPHVVRGVARRLEPDQLLAVCEDRVRGPEEDPRQLVVHDGGSFGVDHLALGLIGGGAASREQLVQAGVRVVAVVAADRHVVDRL